MRALDPYLLVNKLLWKNIKIYDKNGIQTKPIVDKDLLDDLAKVNEKAN